MSAQRSRPRPNFFIIGAPKCGTTSLYEYLKGHPQVFMSAAKEPGYFAPDNLKAGSHLLRYGEDEERYLALFADAGQVPRLGEATVGYLYSSQAPGLIHEFDPEARIIAMFRNPVEMIHSLHNQRLAEGREEIPDFGQAIEAEAARVGEAEPTEAGAPRGGTYRDRGLFSQYLPRWLEQFGQQRVHVIILDDLERDPATEFRRTLEFLEVDPTYQPEFRVHNVRHQPRSQVISRLLKSSLPQSFVWKILPRIVGDASTRRLVRRFRHSPLTRKRVPRTDMDAKLRGQLEDYFTPDVTRLSAFLGRDLGELWWGRSTRTPG